MDMLMVVILSALFLTSATMSGALWVAWRSFGRPEHARSWAIAFAVGTIQALVNAIALLSGREPVLMLLAFLLVLVPSPVGAIGARQRADLPTGWRGFAAAGSAVAIFMAVSLTIPTLRPFGLAAASGFGAIATLLFARAIKPREGTPEPAERLMIAAVLTLAMVEAVSAVFTWAFLAFPADTGIAGIYHVILAICLPPAIVAVGVSEILLLASDLAVSLRRVAANDPLTGVSNRRGFSEAATRAISSARRLRTPVTIVLADIDHFKSINDRFGHTAGDRTLCFVASRLAEGVRLGDLVARIGGEEFAMLLLDSGADQARAAIDRVREDISAGHSEDGAPVPVTVSFGIGEVVNDTADPDAVLAAALDRADRALYLSKIEGRNRVTVAG